MMLKPGDILGNYQLIKVIGRGAFASVWVGKKLTNSIENTLEMVKTSPTSVEVAIKVINEPVMDEDRGLRERLFRKEVTIWKSAGTHPNINPILEADIYENYKVIVSPYRPDGSLEHWLKQQKDQPLAEAASVHLMKGILAGLSHLHNRNIAHRDLAPKNILLQNGNPLLMDFGLSKLALSISGVRGSVVGTPTHMAPEVFEEKTSRRSDIWSVGVVFYEMLTASLPFKATNLAALATKILRMDPDPLPENISPQVAQIVYRALSKDREQRFQTAQEMLNEINLLTL